MTLIKARSSFFLTRQFRKAIQTPDSFVIQSGHQLVTYWSLFVERECWASEWIEALRGEPSPVFLDVGANAGLFTHLVWSLRPDAQFFAFEPLPRMAKKISEWKDRTNAKLTLHEAAVSDHLGTASFYASEEGDPTASLKPQDPKEMKLTVPLVTVDSVIPQQPILLIKIDVEGCECEALDGAKQTLERTRFLIVEAHNPDALKRIQSQLGSSWRSKRVGASDFLFSRSADKPSLS
jgi:FkbM family methyltransferase